MYPVLRMTKDILRARQLPPIDPFDTHVSHHICWPWDLDVWLELNNGRTMTLYDLGRFMLSQRVGLVGLLWQQKWQVTVAGTSVRFRRRVRVFERVEVRSRCVGWDAKFIYLEQSMWKPDGQCANHALLRTAVTDRNGTVSPDLVFQLLGGTAQTPALPDWIQAWCQAEAKRPWPPIENI